MHTPTPAAYPTDEAPIAQPAKGHRRLRYYASTSLYRTLSNASNKARRVAGEPLPFTRSSSAAEWLSFSELNEAIPISR
jgi:hypothetical protein